MNKIVGIDEVGRGCLAGPVVACAVVISKNLIIKGATDSKKLSFFQREALFPLILQKIDDFALGFVFSQEIDRLNIHHASLLAMLRAVQNLSIPYDKIYVDGRFPLPFPYLSEAVVKGDLKIPAISLASILAKVIRDRYLIKLAKQKYFQYALEKNKGYPTKEHKKLIEKMGLSDIHRKTFKFF